MRNIARWNLPLARTPWTPLTSFECCFAAASLWVCGMMVLSGMLIVSGCARAPSNEEIKELARKVLLETDYLPMRLTGLAFVLKELEIKDIQIVERGSYNREKKSWPIKLRYVGSCRWCGRLLLGGGKKRDFDGIVSFSFFKDDFGKWKYSLID